MEINLNIITVDSLPLEMPKAQQASDLSEELCFVTLLEQVTNIDVINEFTVEQPQIIDMDFPQEGKHLPAGELTTALENDALEKVAAVENKGSPPKKLSTPIQKFTPIPANPAWWVEPVPEKVFLPVSAPLLSLEQIPEQLNAPVLTDLTLPSSPSSEAMLPAVILTPQENVQYETLDVAEKSPIITSDDPAQEKVFNQPNHESRSAINNRNIDEHSVKHIYEQPARLMIATADSNDHILAGEYTQAIEIMRPQVTMENALQGSQLPEVINAQFLAQDLSSKIRMMVSTHQSQATIQITPPELGSMEINITQLEDKTHITFISNVEHTRQLIENHIDKLASQLAQNGISLGDVYVAQEEQSFSHPQLPQIPVIEKLTEAQLEQIDIKATMQPMTGLLDVYV